MSSSRGIAFCWLCLRMRLSELLRWTTGSALRSLQPPTPHEHAAVEFRIQA